MQGRRISDLKIVFRILWLLAVIFGGLSAVIISSEIMENDGKKYIDV
jgi:hypothetical protein